MSPSVYSNSGPSASSTSLHQQSAPPSQHLSPYPSSNPAPRSSSYQYSTGGGPPQNVGYGSSSPNLAVPNGAPVQRNRTQSSGRSMMEESWESRAVAGVVPPLPSSSSALYGSGSGVGSGGLTPAQAYQAQVGGGDERRGSGGGGIPRVVEGSSPPPPSLSSRPPPPPSSSQGFFSAHPHVAPHLNQPHYGSHTAHSSPTPSSQSTTSSSQHSSYANTSPLPNPHSHILPANHPHQHPPHHPQQPQYHSQPSYSAAPGPSTTSNRPPRLPSFDGVMGTSGLGLGSLPSLSMEGDGGMITPRPSAYDDSELGYLGSGGSGNNSGM